MPYHPSTIGDGWEWIANDECTLYAKGDTSGSIADEECTLRTENEGRENNTTRSHELPICLSTPDIIEITNDGTNGLDPGDTVIDKVDLHVNSSSRDTIPPVKPNNSTIGHISDGQPIRRLCCENMSGPSNYVGIDVETENGHIKWSAPMSEFQVFTESYRAAKCGTSELSDNKAAMAQRRSKTSGVNKNSRTSLLRAATADRLDIVEQLLEDGADADTVFDSGYPLLSWATERGDIELAILLVDKGANLDIPDSYGWTPLSRATDKGLTDLAMLMVQTGASLDIPDSYGWTPLSRATDKGLTELVATILGKTRAESGSKFLRTQESLHDPLGETSLQDSSGNEPSCSDHSTVDAEFPRGTCGDGAPASGSSRISIQGYFPPGTKLEISTLEGSRQTIACSHPVFARNVSASSRSFQFIGDSAALPAFLEEWQERRNVNQG